MPNLSVQLSEESLSDLRQAARSEGLSASEWAAELIDEKLSELRATAKWNEAFSALAGAWSDMPSLDDISSAQRQNSHE